MFNVPSTILINKVCFFFALLSASASEGAAVVRPVPRGADLGCGVPAFCPFPVLSSAFSVAIRHMTLVNAVLFFGRNMDFVIFFVVFRFDTVRKRAFF